MQVLYKYLTTFGFPLLFFFLKFYMSVLAEPFDPP